METADAFIDELVKSTNSLFTEVVRNKEFMDLEFDVKWEMIRSKYPDFITSFPVVVEFMLLFNFFDPKTFKLFLQRLNKDMPKFESAALGKKTDPEKGKKMFCEKQATYAQMITRIMYKRHKKRWSADIGKQVFCDYYNKYYGEMKRIEAIHDDASKKIAAEEREFTEEKRGDIAHFAQYSHVIKDIDESVAKTDVEVAELIDDLLGSV